MEFQCDHVASLLEYLKTTPAISKIDRNNANVIKVTLNEKLGYIGITPRVYDDIWHILRNTPDNEKTQEQIEQSLQLNVIAPILNNLESITPNLMLLRLIIAFIGQRSPYRASYEWINYEFVKQSYNDQILQFLSLTQAFYASSPIELYSASPRLQFATTTPQQKFIYEFRPWKISWWLKPHVSSTTAYLYQHVWDHYNIEHYHEAAGYEEAETMQLISVRRTWVAMREYRMNGLNPNSRINFGYRLKNTARLSASESRLINLIQFGHVMEPELLPNQVRALPLQSIKERILERMKCIDIEGSSPMYLPVTAEQRDLMEEAGHKLVIGRFKIVDKLSLDTSIGEQVKTRIIETVPQGLSFNVEDILRGVQTDAPINVAKDPYGFKIMSVAPYPASIQRIPRLSVSDLTSRSLYEANGITRDSIRVGNLMNRYTDENLSINNQNELENALLTVGLNTGEISPVITITIGGESNQVSISSIGSVLSAKPESYVLEDLLHSTLLSKILFFYISNYPLQPGMYECNLVNSQFTPIFESMWRQLIQIKYFTTRDDMNGVFIKTPSGYGHMQGIFNYASIRTLSMNVWRDFVVDVCSAGQYNNCNVLEIRTQDLATALIIIRNALVAANKQPAIHVINGTGDLLGPSNQLIIISHYDHLESNVHPCVLPEPIPIDTQDDQARLLISAINPNPILPISPTRRLLPNFTLMNLQVDTGFSVRVNSEWAKVNDAVGFVSSISRFTSLRKIGSADWPQAEVSGITDRARVGYLSRLKAYRSSEQVFTLDNFSYSAPRKSHLHLGAVTPEEVVTQTDREIIYYLRKNNLYGKLTSSLNDFGSGFLLNVHQTESNYVMYDRLAFEIEEIEGVSLITGEIKLEDPLPAEPYYDTLCYNSLYFIPSWESYRVDGRLTSWAEKHFSWQVGVKSTMYFNIPVMWSTLYDTMKPNFNISEVEREDQDSLYYIKLNIYPYVECISPSDLSDIYNVLIKLGTKVAKIVPALSDYGYTMRSCGRTSTLEHVSLAHQLHQCLTTIVVQF